MPLRDFLQGASNAAADTVAGPVDLVSWALRSAGVPIGAAPVGGSAWMREKGLTAPAIGTAGLLGEAAGLSAPIAAAAKAPQIARGLLALDDAAMEQARRAVEGQMVRMGGIQPATVWHGSPHKFDKFDSSKIGTGEGAQSYGHGLYLADARNAAESYASMGLPKGIRTWREKDGTWSALLERANGDSRTFRGFENSALAMNAADVWAKESGKNLYKVDLPDEMIGRMLDWDKPISQQAPEVRKALSRSAPDFMKLVASKPTARGGRGLSGEDAHKYLANNDEWLGLAPGVGLTGQPGWTQKIVAERLRQAGIPGIRYLDANSRGAGAGAGAGSSNYVVFPGEEGALRILARNGGLLEY